MKKITVYVAKDCGGCHEVLPLLKELTEKNGVKLKVVDVEKCGDPCDWVRFVPTLKVDGKIEHNVNKVLRSLQ